MKFIKLVPNIFYTDIKAGLSANLFQNEKYAKEHNPEFRLVTNNIEKVYERISGKFPELLHRNLSAVTLRPWGAKEFALTDGQIGIVMQQW